VSDCADAKKLDIKILLFCFGNSNNNYDEDDCHCFSSSS